MSVKRHDRRSVLEHQLWHGGGPQERARHLGLLRRLAGGLAMGDNQAAFRGTVHGGSRADRLLRVIGGGKSDGGLVGGDPG